MIIKMIQHFFLPLYRPQFVLIIRWKESRAGLLPARSHVFCLSLFCYLQQVTLSVFRLFCWLNKFTLSFVCFAAFSSSHCLSFVLLPSVVDTVFRLFCCSAGLTGSHCLSFTFVCSAGLTSSHCLSFLSFVLLA